MQGQARRDVAPARAVAVEEVRHIARDAVTRPQPARLEGAFRIEPVVDAGDHVGERVGRGELYVIEQAGDHRGQPVEVTSARGDHPGAFSTGEWPVEGEAGAGEGEVAEAMGVVPAARAGLDHQRGGAAAERRRLDARVEKCGADPVGADPREHADAVDRMEEREPVEIDPRLVPRRAPYPEFGGVIVLRAHAGEPVQRAEEVGLAERDRLDHVGVGDRAHVRGEVAALAQPLGRDACLLRRLCLRRDPAVRRWRVRMDLESVECDRLDDEADRDA